MSDLTEAQRWLGCATGARARNVKRFRPARRSQMKTMSIGKTVAPFMNVMISCEALPVLP
jgi:hypothetical protein